MQKPRPKNITHGYAGVFLVTEDGAIIGQQRDNTPGIDNPGKIGAFGGTVEPGESPAQAAWRELVEEETNLTLAPSEIIPFFEDVAWRKLTGEWETRHFYYARISAAALKNLQVYEGEGWTRIHSAADSALVPVCRPVVQLLFDKLN